jgi:hypothetical protein
MDEKTPASPEPPDSSPETQEPIALGQTDGGQAEKAEKSEPTAEMPSAPPPATEQSAAEEAAAPGLTEGGQAVQSGEGAAEPSQDSPGQTPPADVSAEDSAKAEQGELEPPTEGEAENFPCPFDEDIGYEIVEPLEEESDDGFASIPAGPTEEVSFEPPRTRGPRRRRDRGRREREPMRAGAPALAAAQQSKKRLPLWLAVAGAAIVIAIVAVVIWLVAHGR